MKFFRFHLQVRIPAAFATLLIGSVYLSPALAGRQQALLIPIAVSGDNAAALQGGSLDRAVVEKLSDRFDIRMRGGGTPYQIEGSAVRIGKSVSFELRVASNDPGAIGKTVVATAQDESVAEGTPGDGLPSIYRRLITEATSNLKLRFFGDDHRAGDGAKIPGLYGTLTRSAVFPGNPISATLGDSAQDGTRQLIVSFLNETVIFRIEGDDLIEMKRIPDTGTIKGQMLEKGMKVKLSNRKEIRFAAIGADGFPALFDRDGKRLGAATESIFGIDGLISQPRLLPVDLDSDGVDELIAVHNLVTPGLFFESVKIQSGAELLAFAQDGNTLRLAWRTPQTGFGVVDAFVLEDLKAKTARRFGLLVREKGKLLEGQSEWRIVWMR